MFFTSLPIKIKGVVFTMTGVGKLSKVTIIITHSSGHETNMEINEPLSVNFSQDPETGVKSAEIVWTKKKDS